MAEQSRETRIGLLTNNAQTIVLVLTFVGTGLGFWLSIHDKQVLALERQDQLAKSLVETNQAIASLAKSAASMDSTNAATQQVLVQHQRELDALQRQQAEDRKHCDELFAKNLEAFTALLQQLKK